MAKMKMIIDCDTGVDDALAITYILANPDIELLGVTTTFGNVDLDMAATNSKLILELFHKGEIGVYKGASHSRVSDHYERHAKSNAIHGNNGIGNVDLGPMKGKIEEKSAVDFILESARQYKKDLHLVFVGPLTNLAECIEKDEAALKEVGDITIMGGALTTRGNASIYAEANIISDPLSAKIALGSSLDLHLVPLDATHKTLFKVSDIKEWKDINEAGKDLYEIARYYYVRELGGEETGGAMHDPLAAFASYDPSIITNWFACNLTAEESGRTISYFEELNLPRKRHHVALDVDTGRFTKEYIDLVTALIKNN